MRIEDFTVYFKMQKTVLFRYLLKMLREHANYKGDLRPLVTDLVGLIYLESYLKVLKGGLSQLPVKVIIMIKAKDVFYESLRIPKKKLNVEDMPPDIHEIASSDPDPYQQMVLREDMQTLNTLLNDSSREMFENIADQVPGRVIADNLEINISTLTTRIWRERKRIQVNLTKGY
jgi:hypothetical protein